VECECAITLVIIRTGFGLTMPTAFVSYAHENETHRAKAIGLANRLRNEGVDASIDAYDNHPPEGWPKWMEKQSKSDYIIVILSERYIKGFNQEDDSASGARFEGAILSSKLLQSGVSFRNIALVCFDEYSNVQIPDVLVGCTRYFVDRQGEYEKLYTFVTGQPLIEKPTLGKIVVFPHVYCRLLEVMIIHSRQCAKSYGPTWKTTEGYFKISDQTLVQIIRDRRLKQ